MLIVVVALQDQDAVNMKIIHFDHSHFKQVQEIYGQGLETGMATFETSIPDWESWDQSHLQIGRVAVMESDTMLGWASLSPVSNRCVYGGVAEVSVYVSENARGKGIGKILLKEMIKVSEANGIWTLQAGIFRENIASQKIHEACGFRIIGYRERIGQLHGKWKDNLILERRSKKVGV